jgi:hypothetical protein
MRASRRARGTAIDSRRAHTIDKRAVQARVPRSDGREASASRGRPKRRVCGKGCRHEPQDSFHAQDTETFPGVLSESCHQTGIVPVCYAPDFSGLGRTSAGGVARRDVAMTITIPAMITTVAFRICGFRRNLNGYRSSRTDSTIRSGGQLAGSHFGREDGGCPGVVH